MQVLFTHIDGRRFAIDCAGVSEVLPVVAHRPAGAGPAWLLGLFNLHGALVPLVDLATIVCGRPAEVRLGSRIVVVRAAGTADAAGVVGLLVPDLGGPERRDFDDAGAHGGFPFAGASHLGPTIADAEGMVQLIRCTRLLEGDAALRALPASGGPDS